MQANAVEIAQAANCDVHSAHKSDVRSHALASCAGEAGRCGNDQAAVAGGLDDRPRQRMLRLGLDSGRQGE